MMELEVRVHKIYPDEPDSRTVDYIHPLEEICPRRDNDYKEEPVPSDQGELLLQFIRRHLL